VVLPAVEPAEVYTEKMGPEILGQMYTFPDKKSRQLCLRPEGTATCQLLARETFVQKKNVRLWYETRCWRYERPQAGRYREFWQFGVEILNPTEDFSTYLVGLAKALVEKATTRYEVFPRVQRGLAYYVEDGFEIACPALGAQKQVCGGGRYPEGIGFAIGMDRLVLAKMIEDKSGP
jgi:histidyl-tRNA synthetase